MKKGLLLGTIAASTAIACAAGFAIAQNRGIRFEAAKAADKSFTFDGSHGLPSTPGVFDTFNNYQVTSYPSAGDPISVRTEAMLPGGGMQTSYKVGGDYFMTNYHQEGSSNARLMATIGLHNITALTIEYGTTLNYYMSCSAYFYDEAGNDIGNQHHNSGEDIAKVNTFVVDFKELALTAEARKVEIWCYPNPALDNESYFIKSISATWSC